MSKAPYSATYAAMLERIETAKEREKLVAAEKPVPVPVPRPTPTPIVSNQAPAVRPLVTQLAEAANGLEDRDLRVLLWIAKEMPIGKLRSACEEATARGWVRGRSSTITVPMTPKDHTRASLLGTVRQIEGLVGVPATVRRDREDVLADEATRQGQGKKST